MIVFLFFDKESDEMNDIIFHASEDAVAILFLHSSPAFNSLGLRSSCFVSHYCVSVYNYAPIKAVT